MKTKLLIIAAAICCILAGCTVYKASMSEATKDPLAQKLPKMEFEWYSNDVRGFVDVNFVSNIIRNEITHNIVAANGTKSGKIEVICKKLHLKQNFLWASLSGATLFVGNVLGMPFTGTKIDMELAFNILDNNANILDSFEYKTSERSSLGFYYGKTYQVCLVDATKDIMKQFRDDINAKSSTLIAKLENGQPATTYNYAGVQMPVNTPVKQKKDTIISDVDQKIPQTNKKAENTFALIIANEDYQFVEDVEFANHDGEVFKEYCIKTLGIPERQIRYCPDASYGVISGGVDWLKYALDNFEGSNAIVYYCGHGIPDEKTNSAYMIPVDGKGTNTTTCYSLNTLYNTLANTKAAKVTYFMDACFTGANKDGRMLVAARGVAREAKEEVLSGISVVFSASSSDETAMTYPEKGHGLFTYFLLKKLQETSGDVSYAELATYINQHVKKEAFLINEKPQTPVVATSMSAADSWRKMTLK